MNASASLALYKPEDKKEETVDEIEIVPQLGLDADNVMESRRKHHGVHDETTQPVEEDISDDASVEDQSVAVVQKKKTSKSPIKIKKPIDGDEEMEPSETTQKVKRPAKKKKVVKRIKKK